MITISHAVPTQEIESASAQGVANPTRRILVVEDDTDVRSFNAEVLRRSGYRVDTAEDGEVAWKALHAVSYDPDSYELVITDNDMPNVTGVELLRKLRAARMELPVIMATGTLPAQALSQSPWLQPAATLLKPYTAEELLETVGDVLRETDSRHALTPFPPSRRRQPSAVGW